MFFYNIYLFITGKVIFIAGTTILSPLLIHSIRYNRNSLNPHCLLGAFHEINIICGLFPFLWWLLVVVWVSDCKWFLVLCYLFQSICSCLWVRGGDYGMRGYSWGWYDDWPKWIAKRWFSCICFVCVCSSKLCYHHLCLVKYWYSYIYIYIDLLIRFICRLSYIIVHIHYT